MDLFAVRPTKAIKIKSKIKAPKAKRRKVKVNYRIRLELSLSVVKNWVIGVRESMNEWALECLSQILIRLPNGFLVIRVAKNNGGLFLTF